MLAAVLVPEVGQEPQGAGLEAVLVALVVLVWAVALALVVVPLPVPCACFKLSWLWLWLWDGVGKSGRNGDEGQESDLREEHTED